MLCNLMWSQDSDIIIKEEQDVCSEDGSPRILETLTGSAYTDYGVTVLTPTDSYAYLEPAHSPHLQTLQPLPSFHSLPSSPSRKPLEYIPVSLSELVNSGGAHSPDSTGQPVLSSTSSVLPNHSAEQRRRKRTNSGSSCSSGTSSTSKPSKRRRPQQSQEEILFQRDHANKRERQRTESLNKAFSSLREIVPTLPSDKLSKIQTLRLASKYIDFLSHVLNEGGQQCEDARNVREELYHSFNVWRMDMNYRSTGGGGGLPADL